MEMQVEQAHHQAVDARLQDVADYLQDLLSRRLVAYIAGVKDVKTVSRWANGEVEARQEAERRLRAAYQIALLLTEFDSPRIVKAWFIGLIFHPLGLHLEAWCIVWGEAKTLSPHRLGNTFSKTEHSTIATMTLGPTGTYPKRSASVLSTVPRGEPERTGKR
jgi:hypothetical protein